jgi:hypothetical protein
VACQVGAAPAALPGRGSATLFLDRPGNGCAGVILMQLIPFANSKAVALLDGFEKAVYAAVS